jgi:hypothetical protein
MEKSKILVIGCGGCGNRQLDVLLDYDKRYTGIFFNTNLAEMETLHHFDIERRCFHISNADGTGKRRDVAEHFIKQEAPKFAEMIQKFVNQSTVVFLTSANGGTGSKATILLSILVKRLCPEKSLNIVATFPSLNENDVDFENAIDFWNEVVDLKNKHIIDTIQFIDNNKSFSEEEVNIRAMKELDEGFSIVGGKIDSSDSKRVHTSKGYKVILKLDRNADNTYEAIKKCVNQSVFWIPTNLECDVAIGNLNVESTPLSELRKEIEIYDFSKFNETTNGDSILALGGCQLPKEAIELIKEALREIKNKKKRRIVDEDLIVRKGTIVTETVAGTVSVGKSKLSSADLNSLFADDDFWK